MKKCNPKNELLKEKFFEMLEGAKGRDPKTVQAHANAICEFEIFTNFKDFKKFERKNAIEFKSYIANKTNQKTGEPVSKSYLLHYTSHVKAFFEWLTQQKGYRNMKFDDVQYFNITRNDKNRALATSFQEGYEVYEIIDTVRKMPSTTEIEKRNKALISLCFLTTPRISALQSARIQSIKYFKSYNAYAFVQNPNLINTKFAKNITSYFIGSVQDIYDNVLNWQEYLRKKGFSEKDPLFPRITPSFTSAGEQILIMEKVFIKSQTTIRNIFRHAFEANNLPYRKPHTFRHSMVRKALISENSPALISALNQNTGQALNVGTIIESYGTRPEHQRAGIFRNFELND